MSEWRLQKAKGLIINPWKYAEINKMLMLKDADIMC